MSAIFENDSVRLSLLVILLPLFLPLLLDWGLTSGGELRSFPFRFNLITFFFGVTFGGGATEIAISGLAPPLLAELFAFCSGVVFCLVSRGLLRGEARYLEEAAFVFGDIDSRPWVVGASSEAGSDPLRAASSS